MRNKTKQSLVTGTAILGFSAFVTKLLGAVYRVPYQNITGDVGLGIYNKVYPLYSTLLILAAAGFPIAISKFVSERLALGDINGAKRIFKISAYILSFTGFIFFLILFFGASFIATLMGNIELTIAIKSVSFALLIVPVMAALRGYYQGHQYMTPTAYSQIIEQIIRVITILTLSYLFMTNGYGVYYAGAGAVLGATTGAIFAFIALLFFWKKVVHTENEILEDLHTNSYVREKTTIVIKQIVYYSIPIAISALALPTVGVGGLVDSFSVSNIISYRIIHSAQIFGTYFKQQNLTQYAEYWYGIYTRGQPLVQFSAFFATALFLALVPAISEAYAKGNMNLVARRSSFALRLTLLVGLPASVGLAILAEPINIMLYKNGTGSIIIAILGFTTIVSTLFVTSSGILQGIGRAKIPARNLLIGIITKILLNIVLVYSFHAKGAAISTVLTYTIVMILNFIDINKMIGLKIKFTNFFLKPFIATMIMALVVYVTKILVLSGFSPIFTSERLLNTTTTLISVFFGVITFGFSLFMSGSLTRNDLERIPRYGNKLIVIANRLRILKD